MRMPRLQDGTLLKPTSAIGPALICGALDFAYMELGIDRVGVIGVSAFKR
jgi:hypothetical protein